MEDSLNEAESKAQFAAGHHAFAPGRDFEEGLARAVDAALAVNPDRTWKHFDPKARVRTPEEIAAWLRELDEVSEEPDPEWVRRIDEASPEELKRIIAEEREADRRADEHVRGVFEEAERWEREHAERFSVDDPESPFYGCPPCFVNLLKRGKLGHGSRNGAFFNYSIYAKKRWGARWQSFADDFNRDWTAEPLPTKETKESKASVGKKDYHYTCTRMPLVDACDRALCLTRRFGVRDDQGGDNDKVRFGRLKMVSGDKPYWRLPVNGREVEIHDLGSQAAFRTALIGQARVVWKTMPQKQYDDFIQGMLDDCEESAVDDSATIAGLVRFHLNDFLTNGCRAKVIDELLDDNPWFEDGRVHFTLPSFIKHLTTVQKAMPTKEKLMATLMLDLGAEVRRETLKGKRVDIWSVPEGVLTWQTEPLDVPRLEPETPL
jgi:hypothetical protein